jgi:hypothetical protein
MTAFSAHRTGRATSTEILMSLVVIMPMLTPASASAANICAATPVCVCIRCHDRQLRRSVPCAPPAPSSLRPSAAVSVSANHPRHGE